MLYRENCTENHGANHMLLGQVVRKLWSNICDETGTLCSLIYVPFFSDGKYIQMCTPKIISSLHPKSVL